MAGNGTFVSLNGNITRDAEVRSTNSGQLVVSFGIACNGSRKNAQTGQWEDVPHFFDVTAFPSDAQLKIIQPKLVQGAKAHIEGELRYQRWTDKQTGKDRSKVSVAVTDPVRGIVAEAPRNAQQGYQPEPAYGQGYQQPQAAQQPVYAPPYNQAPQPYQQPQAQQYQPAEVYDEDIPF